MELLSWLYSLSSIFLIAVYIPQIIAVCKSQGPLEEIALLSWVTWTVCTFISFAYGHYILHDFKMALFSLLSSVCCFIISVTTVYKRRKYAFKAA